MVHLTNAAFGRNVMIEMMQTTMNDNDRRCCFKQYKTYNTVSICVKNAPKCSCVHTCVRTLEMQLISFCSKIDCCSKVANARKEN